MTAMNGDLLYIEVLKKEKSYCLINLSRRRFQSRFNLINLLLLSFVASLCLFYFSLVYFQYMCFLSTIMHSRFRLTAEFYYYCYIRIDDFLWLIVRLTVYVKLRFFFKLIGRRRGYRMWCFKEEGAFNLF